MLLVSTKALLVRAAADTSSRQCGTLPASTVVVCLSRCTLSCGTQRAHIVLANGSVQGDSQPLGWVSSTSKEGSINLLPTLKIPQSDESYPSVLDPDSTLEAPSDDDEACAPPPPFSPEASRRAWVLPRNIALLTVREDHRADAHRTWDTTSWLAGRRAVHIVALKPLLQEHISTRLHDGRVPPTSADEIVRQSLRHDHRLWSKDEYASWYVQLVMRWRASEAATKSLDCASVLRRFAFSLLELARDPTQHRSIRASGAVPSLVALLGSRGLDPSVEVAAAAALSLLAMEEEGADTVLADGAAAALVALLEHGPDSELAKCAATALGNAAVVSREATQLVTDAGAVEPLVRLLAVDKVVDEGAAIMRATARVAAADAANALATLAFEHAENQARMLRAGVVAPLLELVQVRGAPAADECVELAAAALSALAGGNAEACEAIRAVSTAIPALVQLLKDARQAKAAKAAKAGKAAKAAAVQEAAAEEDAAEGEDTRGMHTSTGGSEAPVAALVPAAEGTIEGTERDEEDSLTTTHAAEVLLSMTDD